jgi:hypothetical protein
VFSQKTVIYDYTTLDYKIIDEKPLEDLISTDNWENWATPQNISTVHPVTLKTITVNEENEYYNIGVVLYNEAVLAFNIADTTTDEILFDKLRDKYIFYWNMSEHFLKKAYAINKSRNTLLILKHIYARLNKANELQEILNLLSKY